MIPLLTLGIPGDSVTAIMLGALMMQGITPGPLLFSTQTVDVYSIIISLFMANVFMCLLGYGAIRIFSKISLVPMKWLNPIVFVFCVVGTYAINNNIYDVFLMIGAGIVGYFLIKLDFWHAAHYSGPDSGRHGGGEPAPHSGALGRELLHFPLSSHRPSTAGYCSHLPALSHFPESLEKTFYQQAVWQLNVEVI